MPEPAQLKKLNLPWMSRLVAAGAIGLAVWALRVALIGDLGTGLPVMDQWSHEGLINYTPWIEGKFFWGSVYEPYLEHRIAWTNLWNLVLFELCGQWDPMVQMVAQAAIPALTAAGCVWALLSVSTGRIWRSAVILGALIGFGGPFAYENILWGFQSCFAIFVALSLVALGATAMAWRNARYVWLILIFGLASPLAMGAGVVLGPTIIVLSVLVMLTEKTVNRRSIWVIGVGLVCTLWGLCLRGGSSATLYAYAKSASQFTHAWLAACVWPNSRVPWLVGLACLPLLILTIQIMRRRISPQPYELFIIGICSWAIACAAGGAWARGGLGPTPPSRYSDFLALLCWANLLALILVMRTWREVRNAPLRWGGGLMAIAWLGSAIYGGSGLVEVFFKTERPKLQVSAWRQFEQIRSILEAMEPAAGSNRAKVSGPLLPHDKVMASLILAPFLPAELQRPFPGITREGLLAIGLVDLNKAWQWQSGRFDARMSAMIVFVSGDSKQLKLDLLNQAGEKVTAFKPSARHIGEWEEWLACAGPGSYRLRIESAPVPDGVGILLPRPLSAAGYWARWISAEYLFLLELAGVCLAMAFLILRTTDKSKGHHTTVIG